VERNHKAGQNPPRVVAPNEEEEVTESTGIFFIVSAYRTQSVSENGISASSGRKGRAKTVTDPSETASACVFIERC